MESLNFLERLRRLHNGSRTVTRWLYAFYTRVFAKYSALVCNKRMNSATFLDSCSFWKILLSIDVRRITSLRKEKKKKENKGVRFRIKVTVNTIVIVD